MAGSCCMACGSSLDQAALLRFEEVDGMPNQAGSAALRCPSCGLVQAAAARTRRGALEVLRDTLSGLDSLIGLLLLLLLVFILGIWVVAPLSLAFQLLREGEFVRAGLLVALVASYSILGSRAAIRREFGPAVAAVGLMILAGVIWLSWKTQ